MKAVSEKTMTNERQLSNVRRKTKFGSPLHDLVSDFLVEEAALLDSYRLKDWLETLAPDILYTAPVRVTRKNSESEGNVDRGTLFFHDDYDTLKLRVARFDDTPSAWAEDPRSRTRRFISNIMVWETDRADEFDVRSYIQLSRNRSDSPAYHWITAERNDVVRLVGEETLKLVRREIILDASVLGVSNLALFL